MATISKSRFDKPSLATAVEDRPTVKAFQAEVEAAQAKRRHQQATAAAAAAAAYAAEVAELGDKVDEIDLDDSDGEQGTLLVSDELV